MTWPRDLVVRRPTGTTVRQPCPDEQAVWISIRRLARYVHDGTWTVEPHQQPGAAIGEADAETLDDG